MITTLNTMSAATSFYKERKALYVPQEDETIFIIARHGENESNVANTYDGRTLNLPLTEKGLQQGVIAGQNLKNKVTHIDHIITTSMGRTHETALKMLEAFPESAPTFSKDDRFLERNSGKYEGGPLTALEFTNKQDKEVSASSQLFDAKMNFSPEEGQIESYASVWERAHAAIQEGSKDLKGKVVLVVTHSGTIRSIFWHLTQKLGFFVPYSNFKPDNGAFMVVSAKNGEISLHETNDIK